MGNQVGLLEEELDYVADTTDVIRQALHGYVGDGTIASEMVQNADDAEAEYVAFHFSADALLIRNDRCFSDEDFSNIRRIGSGSKRAAEGKIGTWGTGFLSVYHLTDAPEVLSSAKRLVFDPQRGRAKMSASSVIDSTEFRLPWRRRRSTLAERVEARAWSDADIHRLKENLATTIYGLIIFLRHVRVIEVYEGEEGAERLLYRVERRVVGSEKLVGQMRERCSIEYRRAGTQARIDTWLYYRADVRRLEVEGITPKDTGIAIAFPLETRDWLDQHVPPRLYNFLPTPITTPFGFQINGAFFPDSNRRGILTDKVTQPKKADWNEHVIQGLAQLFTIATPDIRDQVKEPRRLYELLPVVRPAPAETFLLPIYETFLAAAPRLLIVRSTLGDWRRPGDVTVGRPGSPLPELAGPYMPVLAGGATETFRGYLTGPLKVPQLDWPDVLHYLRPRLAYGQLLGTAHAMINSREKLRLLYRALPVVPPADRLELLSETPICLSEEETLFGFAESWRAGEKMRRLLAGDGPLFVDTAMQADFPGLFNSLVPEFAAQELVNWLADRCPQTPLSPDQAPALYAHPERLIELLHLIAADATGVCALALARLPLVRTASGLLLSGQDGVYFLNDLTDRRLCETLCLECVDPVFASDELIAAVYRKAGVRPLQPAAVVQLLRDACRGLSRLSHQELVERLRTIYAYLWRHQQQIGEPDRQILRALPLCLTQQDQLVAAQADGQSLYLPPVDASLRGSTVLSHLDKLRLDYLIHGDLLLGEERRFLTIVLGLRALDQAALLRVIASSYHHPRLDDAARLDLLHYIDEQMHAMDETTERGLWPVLGHVQLIRCADGDYRSGAEVYFASPRLDAVFGQHYNRPHPAYQVPIARPEDAEQAPYQHNRWYRLFDNLGVNEHPTARDMVLAVQRIVSAGPPDDGRVEVVRRIYGLVQEAVDESVRRSIRPDSELEALRALAWLPASNERGRWFKPKALYRPGVAELVGDQGALLSFSEPSAALRDFLEMPAQPAADLVITHLFAMAKAGRQISRRVYDFLAQNATPEQVARLRDREIIWDNNGRYWRPDRVFMTDCRQQFGARRCYLKPPGGDAQEFLQALGVRAQPDLWLDSLALTREIAVDYAAGRQISLADKDLLWRSFERLGQQAPRAELVRRLGELRKLAVVPGADDLLYEPGRIALSDNPDILNHFDRGTVPIVAGDFATGGAVLTLEALGVRSLGELLRRRMSRGSFKQADELLSFQVRGLADAFRRIAATLSQKGQQSRMELVDKLEQVEIYACRELEVEYSIENKQSGWQVRGFPSTEDKALYEEQHNRLLVRPERNGRPDRLPLALELERMIFPNGKECTLIEQLLSMPRHEVDHYLDERGYLRLTGGRAVCEEEGFDQPILVDWGTADASEAGMPTSAVDGARPAHEQEIAAPPGPVTHQPPTFVAAPATGQLPLPVRAQPTAAPEEIKPQPQPPTLTDLSADVAEIDAPPDPAQADDHESMPAFHGQLRPQVPLRPNDYRKFEARYGKAAAGDEGEEAALAQQVEQGTRRENDQRAAQVSRARFVLTFQNRYEGFLPLTGTLERMLGGRLNKLDCHTDFEDVAFDLAVDYNQRIVYNQDALPAFFDANNIPAGGIVYLELLHERKVRLFWEPRPSSLQQVRCLELREDGTVAEIVIPALEFPCEISEYVLRSEKRLEDPEALFQQAIEQPGLFQIMWELFDEPGRELTFDEIYHGVVARRQFAAASIRLQLIERPCFVPLRGDRWRFTPARGYSRNRPRLRPVAGQLAPRPAADPYATLLEELCASLAKWREQIRPHTASREQLQNLIAWIETLARQSDEHLRSLEQPAQVEEDPLGQLWRHLAEHPADARASQELELWIWQQAIIGDRPSLLARLAALFESSRWELRGLIFCPPLLKAAARAANEKQIDAARDLYKLAQEAGLGDFGAELAALDEMADVRAYIELLGDASAQEDRWELLYEAWARFPGLPQVREAIQQEVTATLRSLAGKIQQLTAYGEADGALRLYHVWMGQAVTLATAWHNSSAAGQVWALVQGMFNQLLTKASTADDAAPLCREALGLLAPLPLSALRIFPVEDYMEAIQDVAEALHCAGELTATAALLEYSLRLIPHFVQQPSDYAMYRAHVAAGDACEELRLFEQAYRHYAAAGRYTDSAQRKQQISHNCYRVDPRRNTERGFAAVGDWREQMTLALSQPEFKRLINTEVFMEMIAGEPAADAA